MLKIIILAAASLALCACVVPVGHRVDNDRSDSRHRDSGERHGDRDHRDRDRNDRRRHRDDDRHD